jgi:hypothetical protein
MSFISWLFSNRKSSGLTARQTSLRVGDSTLAESASTFPDDPQTGWRTSEGYQRLLTNFILPNSRECVPKWVKWNELLGEALDSAIERLKSVGALIPVNEPTRRILHGRGAKELKKLCTEHGLKVSGSKEQMAERLGNIDPSASVFGYAGELLKCSQEAELIANARIEAWKRSRLDDPDLKSLFDRREFEAAREQLKQEFLAKGYIEPSDDDVKWRMLNQQATREAKEGNFGLLSNTYLVQAKYLSRRGRLKDALRLTLIVCAYDLNGAQNRGSLSAELLKEFPLFDYAQATLAPAVIESVQGLAEELKISIEEVREVYVNSTNSMGLPLPSSKTWRVLSFAIESKIDLNDQPRCFEQIRSLLT